MTPSEKSSGVLPAFFTGGDALNDCAWAVGAPAVARTAAHPIANPMRHVRNDARRRMKSPLDPSFSLMREARPQSACGPESGGNTRAVGHVKKNCRLDA